MANLTQARVRELFNYDPETGDLTWCARPPEDFPSIVGWKIFNVQCAGKIARTLSPMGKNTYKVVRIDNVLYLQHRIIWLSFNGAWPSGLIDHINGDGTDNRIANLRIATYSQNHANRRYQGKTESGLKGAFRHKKTGKWTGRYDGRYLGLFGMPQEAHEAYMQAAREKHGEFARAE